MRNQVLFQKLRTEYHKNICARILTDVRGHPNMADVSSRSSIQIARGVIALMNHPLCRRPPTGQTVGAGFSEITMKYLETSFNHLQHLRPGSWIFSVTPGRAGIAAFDQYRHLILLKKLKDKNRELSAIMESDYIIAPDIVVARKPVEDSEINEREKLLNARAEIGNHSPLRSRNYEKSNLILHASISCKWTIRSDRAQNIRTEALNLIRNRKGNIPHVVAVIAEPLPTRIASIALGTGDIDCVYHMALNELIKTARDSELSDQYEMLMTLVDGRRLRDISDLVFDLAI